MTEYDYSPEAYERYMATQNRIQDWAHQVSRQAPTPSSSRSPSRSAPRPPPTRQHSRSKSHGHGHASARPRSHSQSHGEGHAYPPDRPPSSRAYTTPPAPQYSRTFAYAMGGAPPPPPQPIPVPPPISYPQRSAMLPAPPVGYPTGVPQGGSVVKYYDPRQTTTIPTGAGQTYVIVHPRASTRPPSHGHARSRPQQAPLLKRLLTTFAAPFTSSPSPSPHGNKGRRLRRRSSY